MAECTCSGEALGGTGRYWEVLGGTGDLSRDAPITLCLGQRPSTYIGYCRIPRTDMGT